MSNILINAYLAEIDRLKRVSGSLSEQVIREAFKDMLKAWSRQQDLVFIAEYPLTSTQKTKVVPDGTILYDLRVPLGYWEAKDTADDLDVEIGKKLAKGYPQDNIIFENSQTAVLIQNRAEVMRCSMVDTAELEKLLNLFFGYERPEIAEFRRAVAQFQADLPAILGALRERIDAAYASNAPFRAMADGFLAHAQNTINPALGEADVREMLIQHILTEEIFTQVFDGGQFHRENNIARELFRLEQAFFTGAVKWDTLKVMAPYYSAIKANAAQISSHAEKQTFLKMIYEGFYKVYNPKAADRLGVVYTPNEIVRFMIEGADWLCQQHFGKGLIDPGVEILDPATGTGTFICEMLEYFRGQPDKLRAKYKEQLHANEVAILPYYVANLNIEATFAAVTGQYAEFPNLCFVDTLDNVAGLGIRSGHQHDMFASLTDENVERVNRQNRRKISVVIGNPPYNAWQGNYNDHNANRSYRDVDNRIRETFVKSGTSQNQNSIYDMYTRFLRWSFDRLPEEGVVAFVTNSSFIDSRTYDGFRRYVQRHFCEAYLVDLKGNARTSGERRRREGGNVFDDKIKVGIAISLFVKKRGTKGFRAFYKPVADYGSSREKRDWLATNPLSRIMFNRIEPDSKASWIDQTDTDWQDLLPLIDPEVKAGRSGPAGAVFRMYSRGVATQRDEWVYDTSPEVLERKVRFLIDTYEATRRDPENPSRDTIKWDPELDRHLKSNLRLTFDQTFICDAEIRPFTRRHLYFDRHLNGRVYKLPEMFQKGAPNALISFSGMGYRSEFMALSADGPVDLHFGASIDAYQFVTRYRYTKTGERVDNITDWGLNQFTARYGKAAKITKDDIFHYVYGVLHDPVYRETYAQNLKRELPRIPLYPDFRQWAEWGARLMALHIGYETIEPWPLRRIDTPDRKAREAGVSPKVILRSDPANGRVTLDSETALMEIPAAAWDYRLGNRTAIDWVLDQHKEKTPKDPTIREKFNTYRFADYKEKVVDLLSRVTRVSVETVAITEAMRSSRRD